MAARKSSRAKKATPKASNKVQKKTSSASRPRGRPLSRPTPEHDIEQNEPIDVDKLPSSAVLKPISIYLQIVLHCNNKKIYMGYEVLDQFEDYSYEKGESKLYSKVLGKTPKNQTPGKRKASILLKYS